MERLGVRLLQGLMALGLPMSAGFAASPPPAAVASAKDKAAPIVILVRHAEKSAEGGSDPALSPTGAARADALKEALRDMPVTAIITTHFRRTRETAQPIAALRGITPQVISAGKGSAHAEAVAAAVRQHGEGAVLVVGHSNTVPAIIAALGGPHLPDICESAYSHLFTLIPGPGDARLVKSRYGAADRDGGPECKPLPAGQVAR